MQILALKVVSFRIIIILLFQSTIFGFQSTAHTALQSTVPPGKSVNEVRNSGELLGNQTYKKKAREETKIELAPDNYTTVLLTSFCKNIGMEQEYSNFLFWLAGQILPWSKFAGPTVICNMDLSYLIYLKSNVNASKTTDQ